MITKVVLGVALVLIECSFITSSQNNSLSANNDPSNAPDTNVNISNVSLSETTTSPDFPRMENSSDSITNSDTSTTIKLKIISNFTSTVSPDTHITTTTSPITSTEVKREPTTVAAATTDFKLPENCSAYEVREMEGKIFPLHRIQFFSF